MTAPQDWPGGPPRVPRLLPADLTSAQRELFERITTGPRAGAVALTDVDGALVGPFGLMLLAPHAGGALEGVGAALRTDTELTPRMRELAILTTAAHRRCAFEWTSHTAPALAAGLTREQLDELITGQVPHDLDDAERCAVLTTRSLLTDGSLDDNAYEHAAHVLGVTALAVLVWLVGYYAALATALAVFRPIIGAVVR
ncbi:carboxymuconolactone decarboxylase family protein [Lentzea sp. CC55]|uniref:carboxymuconolactone decarboxylase family protein n=1 Tax=Lentzea sp. CC55 TaxID=2884909 RepID=UPI001F3D793A|nr:carboxymuconolactone decarboxylase family protein [Lentzea sp. CC55]MCG8927602.1 carboxymuconolactone decarboxylase family protein [Lentzea sp. CC55]